jgi:hypothetical protein
MSSRAEFLALFDKVAVKQGLPLPLLPRHPKTRVTAAADRNPSKIKHFSQVLPLLPVKMKEGRASKKPRSRTRPRRLHQQRRFPPSIETRVTRVTRVTRQKNVVFVRVFQNASRSPSLKPSG